MRLNKKLPWKLPIGTNKVKRDKQKQRGAHLQHSYGITQVDYDLKALLQEGKCAICKEETKLVVDHCHATSKVRGLLCGNCNRGLGCFRDRVSLLLEAARYLE